MLRTNTFILAWALVSFSMLNLSCKDEKPAEEAVQEEVKPSDIVSKSDIEAFDYTEYVLSDAARKIADSWLKFQELDSEIETLKTGDLSFFSNEKDLLKTFYTELTGSLPEALQQASIEVRLLALETNSYKLHDETVFNRADKKALLTAIGEVLVGYSNLIFQINKKLEKDAQKIEKPD